jgi:hypothetical protein
MFLGEDLSVGRRIILKLTLMKWNNMDWIHPTQDRDQWQCLVNTVIDILMKKKSYPHSRPWRPIGL